MSIQKRKKDHLEIMLNKDVKTTVSAGFEDVFLMPQTLPELDFKDIDTKTTFLSKKLDFPILLSSMTGGTAEATAINKNLALAAQKYGIAISVGSQKAMIKHPGLAETYEIRKYAPDVLLIGNIGIDYLLSEEFSLVKLKTALEKIDANALYIHLNVLQELVQPEGSREFAGALKKIGEVIESLGLPVLVKEVGSGIDLATAYQLEKEGVSAIDVAGVGGTSWAAIEGYRGSEIGETFRSWGIPTALNLLLLQNKLKIPTIGSGGLKTGYDAAKAIALGADLAGFAGQVFKKATEISENLEKEIEKITTELKTTMILVGAKDILQLKETKILLKGITKELKEQV